jgi:Holliday junction DNA helicase RuvA
VIERLTGTVAAKTEEGVVLDVAGVGYLIEVSGITLRDVPQVGESAMLFTHLQVREDALQLFGFSTEEERRLFRLFLGVSKIGPKLALAVCSCRRPADLRRALAAGDIALFASVSGIGKKTAERLVLELREKVAEPGLGPSVGESVGAFVDEGSLPLARDALVELGFSTQEAERRLASLEPDLPVEELVRQALGRRS